jgi:hypothetical protein
MTHRSGTGTQENELTIDGSIADSDYVRTVTGNGGQSRRITFATLKSAVNSGQAVVNAFKTISAGTYQILSADNTILLDTSSAGLTTTLPDATLNAGLVITVKKISTSNTGTIQTLSAQTIDGSATYVLGAASLDFATVISDGTNWHVVGA